MKKITSLFLVLLMAIGVNAQRTLASSWDFAALATAASADLTPMTYSNETVKVGGTASNLGTGDYEGLAMQGANNFYLRTEKKAIENRNGGARKIGVLNLVEGQIITIVASTTCLSLADANTAIEQSVTTADGKTTYVYVMVADGILALSNARNTFLYSIVVENPDPNAGVVPVTGIALDKTTAEITEGMVVNLLTATIAPADATDKTVTWTSSNEAIATVDGGQVTGVALGTATITAVANGFTATCQVTVKAKANLTSWDFATLQASLPNKTGMTYAVNTVKVGGVDCNYGINEYEGLAMQGAGSWFLYTDGGLYNGNSGGRNIGVLNLKKGQIVTVVTNTDTGLTLADATTATQLSVETADGLSTYTYGMKADGTLALNLVRNKVVASINIEESSILVVTDGEDLDAEGTYDAATYTRTVNPQYNYGTICLPFAPDAETLENYTFYELGQSTSSVVTFVEVENPQANMPYLYSAVDKEAETHTFTGEETTVVNETNLTSAGNWAIKGVFAEEVVSAIGGISYYAYSPLNTANQSRPQEDVLVKVTNSLTVKPYRAYFMCQEQMGSMEPLATVRIVVRGQGDNGDGTTAIEEVITPDQIEGAVAPAIYDLMGRSVQNPMKGQIYIVNGQKVVF